MTRVGGKQTFAALSTFVRDADEAAVRRKRELIDVNLKTPRSRAAMVRLDARRMRLRI